MHVIVVHIIKEKKMKKMTKKTKTTLIRILKRILATLEKNKDLKITGNLTIEEINPEDMGREDIREL